MIPRSVLILALCPLAFSSALGALRADATTPARKDAGNPEPPKYAVATKQPREAMGKEKALLNRLVTELQHSSRSFVYLRSIGFTETDEEFDRLIATNNRMFKQTRIVRRDERGSRKIPGWPGITLKEEYKAQRH